MPRVRAVLFDLDGTLADTLRDIGESMNEALRARGLPVHPIPAYRDLIGGGAVNLARRAAPGSPDAVHEELAASFRAIYAEGWVRHATPYPGVPELLDALQERGYRLAVLSNKLDSGTKEIVAALFPGVPFSPVYGERAGVPRKPDPKAALEIAALLGLSPAECAYVGDSEFDVETAARAGMSGVSVLWGFRDRPFLEAAGARAFAAVPSDVLTLLEETRERG